MGKRARIFWCAESSGGVPSPTARTPTKSERVPCELDPATLLGDVDASAGTLPTAEAAGSPSALLAHAPSLHPDAAAAPASLPAALGAELPMHAILPPPALMGPPAAAWRLLAARRARAACACACARLVGWHELLGRHGKQRTIAVDWLGLDVHIYLLGMRYLCTAPTARNIHPPTQRTIPVRHNAFRKSTHARTRARARARPRSRTRTQTAQLAAQCGCRGFHTHGYSSSARVTACRARAALPLCRPPTVPPRACHSVVTA